MRWGSAAYGPEAALTILLPLVARQNLGAQAGLVAGAALILDYLMNVAVGIATGVGALVSAVPALEPHTLRLCLVVLGIITFVNLRGVRETGVVLMVPTYLFIGCLVATIAIGMFKAVMSGGAPTPVVPPPKLDPGLAGVSVWMLLRAFASGCTAMTCVEAVSNGVQAFREPVVRTAQRTLTVIIAVLAIMLVGIAVLARSYSIGATTPARTGYESVLSQLVGAVMGKGAFYYVTIGSILVVLSLSANTSFADFPRLCRAMSQNGYLPYEFAARGQRLVYSYGVYSLALLSAVILIVFGGVTDRLIPLFAIGAFLSFTLSQAGMVGHWRKVGGRGSTTSLAVNGLGAAVTGITVLIVAAAKFTEGAWITLVLIPSLITLMVAIRRHYHRVAKEVSSVSPLDVTNLTPPILVVQWRSGTTSRRKRSALPFHYRARCTCCTSIRVMKATRCRRTGTNGSFKTTESAGLRPPSWSWSTRLTVWLLVQSSNTFLTWSGRITTARLLLSYQN